MEMNWNFDYFSGALSEEQTVASLEADLSRLPKTKGLIKYTIPSSVSMNTAAIIATGSNQENAIAPIYVGTKRQIKRAVKDAETKTIARTKNMNVIMVNAVAPFTERLTEEILSSNTAS